MGDAYRLEAFDQENPPPGRIVAEMHARLLPTSPLVKLGEDFLETFCYRILVQEGAILGTVAWIGESPAGFITITDDYSHFMKNALKRRLTQVVQAGATSLLKKPARVATVFEILRLMTAYESQPPEDAEGEILSLGIEEEFRTPEFISQCRRHIAIDLLEGELGRLRVMGRKRVRAVVNTSNMAAQLLYRGLGWTLKRTVVHEWRVPSVEFVLDL